MAGGSSRRYVALDGLRGLAALIVLCHHLGAQTGSDGPFSRGFLAVDFFFLLSGFVVASAYEDRLAGAMSGFDFARARFLRLYPMMFLGSLVGVGVAGIMGPASLTLTRLVGQFLLIPGVAGAGVLFPLNAAYWSLLFESFANAGHAMALRWLSVRQLVAWVALAAVGVVFTAFRMHHLGGGFSVHNWWAGLTRVGFSYPLGVLFYRLHREERLPRPSLSFVTLGGALIAGIALASRLHVWWGDVLTVFLVFPPLLAAGVSARMGRWASVAGWVGGISYPLYALHAPLVEMWGRYCPHSALSVALAFGGCVVLAAVVERWIETGLRAQLGALLAPRPFARRFRAAGH